jgi:4-hydroxybenzoate polyprenyltransferase
MPAQRGIRAIFMLLRPRQWTKNLLVFAGAVFGDRLGQPLAVGEAFLAFAAFCLASSALYVLNDLVDRPADALHPSKRLRPLAAGAVRPRKAALLVPVLAAGGLSLAALLPPLFGLGLGGYLVLGVLYTFVLKRVVIVDVLALSAGFVLRAAGGAWAVGVAISPWLLICTMLLALFLGIAKRRAELILSPATAALRTRAGSYSRETLDQMMAVVTSSTLMAYILYAFSDQTTRKFPSGLMPLTIPFVLYGIFRYLFLVYRRGEGGEPEAILLRDRPLMAGIVLWAAAVLAAVYIR